jgi:hypothetical protein
MKAVGLFYVNCGRPYIEALAGIMIASVREAINGAHVVQLTNEHTRKLPGVDELLVRSVGNQGLMESRVDHYAHFPYEGLLLDPDIVVQKDPWSVFDEDFDVALTKRSGALIVDGVDTRGTMPYNTGVMFCRNPKFYGAAHKAMRPMTKEERGWFGEQLAVASVAQTGRFNIKTLSCEEFNYSPSRMDEDVSERYIVHYKGPVRKKWMLRKQEIVCE